MDDVGHDVFLGALRASQEISVAGTPQQTNDRIKELTGNSKPAVHDYVIGNGDLLSITVFDVPELTRDVRVSQTGTISIPLVPVRLEVSGLTEIQAEQKIAEVLESNGLVSHAEVGVVVKEHKSKPITIVGAVAHPMVYEADRPVNLLEAIAQAGGVSNDAGDSVSSPGRTRSTFVEIPNPTSIGSESASWLWRACRSQRLGECRPGCRLRTTTPNPARPFLLRKRWPRILRHRPTPIQRPLRIKSPLLPIPSPSIWTNSSKPATCAIISL